MKIIHSGDKKKYKLKDDQEEGKVGKDKTQTNLWRERLEDGEPLGQWCWLVSDKAGRLLIIGDGEVNDLRADSVGD